MQKPLAVVPLSPCYQFPVVTNQNVTPNVSREQLAHVIGCAAQELAPTNLVV